MADENLYKDAMVEYGLDNYKKTIELISKIFAGEINNMENKVMISLLKLRAQSYYKLKFFKEAVDDIDTLINMGFTLNQKDDLFYMYYHASVQSKMDDAIHTLEQVKLICNVNCNKEIFILKQMDIEAMFNKIDRTRKRSQSADRKGKRLQPND